MVPRNPTAAAIGRHGCPGKTTPAWLLVALAVTGIIASIAVFAFVLIVLLSHSVDFTSGEWPLVFVLLLPLFCALARRWAVRYLQTYPWTTFLWPGVLDLAMARELVETVRRADKVEFYEEVLQRRQSVTSDANG